MPTVTRTVLQEVLVSAAEHIRSLERTIVPRQRVELPDALRKTIVFHGVRRSGKTFVLYDLFRRHAEAALYVDFEDDRLAGFTLADFDVLREVFLEWKPEAAAQGAWFLLDEVQNVAGWERFCRRAVEREGLRVAVSGSSSKVMPREVSTALRGRAWSLEVLPFSFAEYLLARGVDADDGVPAYGAPAARLARHFRQFVRWGGFPEVALLENEHDRSKLLREYLSAMFFRDLVERYRMTNVPLLDALSERLFSACATKVSLTAVRRQFRGRFPFSKDLLSAYYGHFLDSMLAFEVRVLAESAYRRMRNPPKIYLVDAGLCRHVVSADAGRLLENAVYLELRRHGCEVFYFQGARECDFVARQPDGRMQAIQVCLELDASTRERKLEGLREACAHLGLRTGTIVTMSDHGELRHGGILVRIEPGWRWCLAGGT